MDFINSSQIIGQIISSGTTTTTGNIFITLLIIVIFLMAIALMFGIPIEYTAVLILPLLLSCLSFYSEFWGVMGVLLLYVSILITKIFIFK